MKKGFTLIELLIVIVIIGILAGIVVGIVGTSAKKKANDTKKKADFHEIQNALEQYFVDHDTYPADATAFETDLVSANLLKEAPATMASKSGGKAYTYTGGTTTYKVSVELENQNDQQGSNIETVNGKKYYFIVNKQ
jgi:general secretion pathway protein G